MDEKFVQEVEVQVLTKDLSTGRTYAEAVVNDIASQGAGVLLMIRTDTHEAFDLPGLAVFPGMLGRCLSCSVRAGVLTGRFGLGLEDAVKFFEFGDVVPWYRLERKKGKVDLSTLTLIAFCLVPKKVAGDRAIEWGWSGGKHKESAD